MGKNPFMIFGPSIRDAPQINHITVPIQKSIRFFIIIFPAFFALVKPASHMANPACIQKTRAAPARNHTEKISPSSDFITSISSFVIFASFQRETPPPRIPRHCGRVLKGCFCKRAGSFSPLQFREKEKAPWNNSKTPLPLWLCTLHFCLILVNPFILLQSKFRKAAYLLMV